jgi:TP901 family phage tail tape measure protein
MTLALRRMVLWWSTAAVLLGAQRLAKQILEVAGSFQLVVKELTILGTEGEQVYRRLAAEAFQAAEQTGRGFQEATASLKSWIRQGYSAVDAAQLMRTTLIGLNLTQLSSIELTRTITAIMRAYGIGANDTISIIDKLVGVSRSYAIETAQLATGIRRFASSARIANVTLDEQIGIMTAMTVRTQQSAQMTGRAGRTIFTRLRRNAIEALETIAKVKVFTDETRQSYRRLFNILTDLAGKWSSLSDVEKENIAFQAAGLRQREFFIALMEDFNVALEANIISLSSVGLAYRSNVLLVNTFQKSVVALRTAWERLLSAQTGILEFADSLVNGLRMVLRVALAIPEGLVAVAAAAPALVTIGGALLTAWSPGLLAIIISIASALTGLTYVVGRLSKISISSTLEEAKEFANVLVQEAENAEKLADIFITLYEREKRTEEVTKLLLKTREGLADLIPDLVSQEDSLDTVYNTLISSIDELDSKTKKLIESRKELLKLEADREKIRSTGVIGEQIRRTPSKLVGKLTDPENVTQSITELRKMREEISGPLLEAKKRMIAYDNDILQLTRLIKDATHEQGELEDELTRKYKVQATIIGAMNMPRNTSLSPYGNLSLQLERLRRAHFKDAKTLEELHGWIVATTQGYLELQQATRTIDRLESDRGDTTTGGALDEELLRKEQAGIKDILEERKRVWTIQWKQQQLQEGILPPMEDALQLRKHIFAESEKLLNSMLSELNTREKQQAIEEAIAAYGPFKEKWQAILIDSLDMEFRRRRKMASEERKAERDRLRAATDAERLVIAGLRLEKEFSQTKVNNIIKEKAADIAATRGKLASLYFIRGVDEENAQAAKDRLKTLRDDPESSQESINKALKERLAAIKQSFASNAAFELAEREHALTMQENAEKIRAIKVDTSVRILSLHASEVVVAEEKLKIAESELAVVEAAGNAEARIGELAKLRENVSRAEGDVRVAKAKEAKAEIEEGLRLEEAQFEATLRQIELEQGRIVATTAILEKKEELLALARKEAGEGIRTQKVIAAEIAVLEAKSALETERLQAKIRFEERLSKIADAAAKDKLQTDVRLAELQGGRIAGLETELAYWNAILVAAEAIAETDEDALRISEAKRIIKSIEGDIGLQNFQDDQDRQKVREQWQERLIAFAGQQVAAAISGRGDISGLITGAAGLGGMALGGPIGAAVIAAGGVVGALFSDSADDMSESLDRNTTAIDRNTQTLQDVFAQRIGVPTGFALPASILMQGALPGGGGVTNVSNQVTINVDGRGQDADQIAIQVERRLDKRFSLNSRRGFGSNVYSLG